MTSSSRPNYPSSSRHTSPSNSEQELRRLQTESVSSGTFPSLNDETLLRDILNASIKSSGKSRDHIADEMSLLLQTRVSRRALDLYTAESAEQNRFPMQYARAFCQVTGDTTLLRALPELAGLKVIDEEEQALLELGREFLRQKDAAAKMSALEAKLSAVKLG